MLRAARRSHAKLDPATLAKHIGNPEGEIGKAVTAVLNSKTLMSGSGQKGEKLAPGKPGPLPRPRTMEHSRRAAAPDFDDIATSLRGRLMLLGLRRQDR
jgi:hypothetical protein